MPFSSQIREETNFRGSHNKCFFPSHVSAEPNGEVIVKLSFRALYPQPNRSLVIMNQNDNVRKKNSHGSEIYYEICMELNKYNQN